MFEDDQTFVVRRFYQGVAEGQYDLIESVLSPNFSEFSADPLPPASGVAFIDGIRAFRRAFPDFSVDIGTVTREGDQILANVSVSCQSRQLSGEASTRIPITLAIADRFQVAGGQIQAHAGRISGADLPEQIEAWTRQHGGDWSAPDLWGEILELPAGVDRHVLLFEPPPGWPPIVRPPRPPRPFAPMGPGGATLT